MAIPAKTGEALVELRRSGSNWYLVPKNAEGKTALDAAYANDSAKTTVAITQEDAGRGGFGDTNQPYKAVKLALS